MINRNSSSTFCW